MSLCSSAAALEATDTDDERLMVRGYNYAKNSDSRRPKKTLPVPACNRSDLKRCGAGRNQEARDPNDGPLCDNVYAILPCSGQAQRGRLERIHFSTSPSLVSTSPSPDDFLQEAIEMAVQNVTTGQGGPFAALVVRDGEIIGRGTNVVTTINDPTAHAEITAIRRACNTENHFELTDCTLYSTCEPCPMCLGAAYWARLDRIYYAATREDAADAGFDDTHIYKELTKPPTDRRLPMEQALQDQAERPFDAWLNYEERVEY